jgi:multiple antibiotic resistance protein
LAIVDPFFAIPTFMALYGHFSPKDRAKMASRVAFHVAIILLTVLGFGSIILAVFGISLGGIRVAGGLIIAFLGFELLYPATNHGHDPKDRDPESVQGKREYVFIPLAFPTLAGPGAMAAVIEFSTLIQQRHSVLEQTVEYAICAIAILVVAAMVWLLLRSSAWFAPKMNANVLTALNRVMGLVLVCIGIEFLPSGIADLVRSLPNN